MVGNHLYRLGFKLSASAIRSNVYVPRYYDPDITVDLEQLRETHCLYTIQELVTEKHIELATGHEIGKMAYGTGTIPFIRTSDISNWELKTDPKQGVSRAIYEEYSARQDVKSGDILFVKDGTYLIGQSCIVTEHDLPLLYQSHIYRIRLKPTAPISPYLFFAALNTPIVKRQIRSKQFTADIIDTIGNRILELVLPIPKDRELANQIEAGIRDIFEERMRLREKIRKIPLVAQGILRSTDDGIQDVPDVDQSGGNLGFSVRLSSIRSNVLIPKYYDTILQSDLAALARTHELVDLASLIRKKVMSWESGIEVGKMAYGTGVIPFIRTSDISKWELKSDPKQSVSEEIYENNKQDVVAKDIFIVSDGTYLVGTSCMVTANETKILYCGGIDRLRVEQTDVIDPYLLLALLNTPIVKRQIRSKQFTRDIIDTLSRRLLEIVLPIPKDPELREYVTRETEEVLEERVALRHSSRELVLLTEGLSLQPDNDIGAFLDEAK